MPNKLKVGTLRVSYVENQAINRVISILATVKGVAIRSLIREATEQYLTSEDPKGEILKASLGAIKRLEFSSISSEDFQKIQTHLADTEKNSAVWPREFDSQVISVLDVETRLDNIGLGQEVTKATSGRA